MTIAPGTICMLINQAVFPEDFGKLATIVERFDCPLDGDGYHLEALQPINIESRPNFLCEPGFVLWAHISEVRPLDGGESADETLAWKAVPSPKQTVPT